MGNASTKESRHSGDSAYRSAAAGHDQSLHDQNGSAMYSSRVGRGSRHDLSFLGFGSRQDSDSAAEPRKETKQERDARRAERDRVARVKERERSLKDEAVDGGYLVTLGTYTGAEDFNKAIVRQLMIERRIAPFWRGLNDHSDSWTEYQLVAAARGMDIPAPDEPPPEDLSAPATPQISNTDDTSQTASIPMQRHTAHSSEGFSNLSASHPAFSTVGAGTPSSPTFPSPSPLFRGRAKTLVSLTSKNSSQAEITPQEIRLPSEPRINGQPIEAFLYKDVGECPICFLYYPPYLNKTRCCDQPICSECFVQVKRPDPHPPEHLDPNTSPPSEAHSPEDDINLVSEVATCPFCKTPEFGVSYEPPPFRRGLAYANAGTPMVRHGSAMSSSSSLAGSNGGMAPPVSRRRTQSLSANDSSVITTDRIRPEWATKLAQAKAHAARRAASATALHTAAYLMGPPGQGGGLLSRRRRVEVRSGEGSSTSNLEQLLAVLEAHEQSRSQRRDSGGDGNGNGSGNIGVGGGLFSGRRVSRPDDLEELMMMEAIRQSIAAEEDRKKKEEKEAAKQQKKEDKQKAKDQKKAEKAAKKTGPSLPSPSGSSFSIASGSGTAAGGTEDDGKGKGKAVSSSETAARMAFNPLNEPTSTLNMDVHDAREDPQKHLEQSRANLDHTHQRQTSSGSSPVVRSRESSLASSVMETPSTPVRNEGSEPQPDASSVDPAISFGSLAAIVDKDGEFDGHHAAEGEPSATRERGSSDGSAGSGPPPHYEEGSLSAPASEQSGDAITAAQGHGRRGSLDQKHSDDVALMEHPYGGQTA